MHWPGWRGATGPLVDLSGAFPAVVTGLFTLDPSWSLKLHLSEDSSNVTEAMKRSGGRCGSGEPVPWLYAAAVTLRWQMVAMEIQALVRYSDFLMKNSPILKFQASVLLFKYHRLSVLLWPLLL